MKIEDAQRFLFLINSIYYLRTFTLIIFEDAIFCLSLAGSDERYFLIMEAKSSRCFVYCLVLLWSHFREVDIDYFQLVEC